MTNTVTFKDPALTRKQWKKRANLMVRQGFSRGLVTHGMKNVRRLFRAHGCIRQHTDGFKTIVGMPPYTGDCPYIEPKEGMIDLLGRPIVI